MSSAESLPSDDSWENAFPPSVAARIEAWLKGPYDEETKREIRRLLVEDPKRLLDSFSQDLAFGTGGMRGLMGVGTDRMNLYTIRKATQGLANYLHKQAKKKQKLSLFIGYDTRHHSRSFALETARVLAGNQITAFLCTEVCPTPLTSFGCRHLRCSGAVMITASHNPPEYNGYKVYGADGGQVVAPFDQAILREVEAITQPEEIRLADPSSPLIRPVGREIDEAYLQALQTVQLCPRAAKSDLKIVYTNLHGTGIRLVPTALRVWGYRSLSFVDQQTVLDGSFPFAPSPNPEEDSALVLGSQQLLLERGDLLLATDPDADRVAAVIRQKDETVRLTGHQIACLCLNHIASTLSAKRTLSSRATCVKSIVTSELLRKICQHFKIQCVDVLTGFKYIGEKIAAWEKDLGASGHEFLFGAEESCGYLCNTFVRDKDAISASCLLAEAAAVAKQEGLTLLDRLYSLYRTYGVHREGLISLHFPESAEGRSQIDAFMRHFRENLPSSFHGKKVLLLEDYKKKEALDLSTRTKTPLSLPISDVLRFWLEDHSKVVIRPSGTEPKIKIYAEVFLEHATDLETAIASCDERLSSLLNAFRE